MIRKILLSCLTLFAFSAVNAQYAGEIVSQSAGCGNVNEFTLSGTVNGKNAYLRSTAPTNWLNDNVAGVPAAVPGSTAVGIQWDGAQWVFYKSNNPADIIFFNNYDNADVRAPGNGWITNVAGVCDGGVGGTTLVLFDDGNGVLPVEDEVYSKMSLYPNPSNGFVQISNLDAPSRVIITNIAGQIVKDVNVDMNNNRIEIDELSKGFYFVEIEGKKTIKLIKQ